MAGVGNLLVRFKSEIDTDYDRWKSSHRYGDGADSKYTDATSNSFVVIVFYENAVETGILGLGL